MYWDLPTRIPHSIEQCAYPESKYNTNEMNTNKTNMNEMKTMKVNTYEMNRKANEMQGIIFNITETPSRLWDNQRIMREISKKLKLLRKIGKALGAITLLWCCLVPKRDAIRWASGEDTEDCP